ncbi:MAG: methyl-accepting chemotaxis protein [Desulfobacteraceae bacterium]|nr:methyl-accepting chemotaxis protein [Desulfobacteraceae bacterium]
MWIYFLPMLMVLLCIGAYLIYESGNQYIRYRIIGAMFAAMTLLMAIPFLFIRNIVEPLEHVLMAVRKITEGNLDTTVPIRNSDEIGKIGEQINALSVNIQEILLHVWNHSRDAGVFLERIEHYVRSSEGSPSDTEQDIALIRNSMEEMQNMVKTFEYYDIRMDDDRLVGAIPSWLPDSPGEKEKIS